MRSMIIGIIMIVVALLLFGVVLDSVSTLQSWATTDNVTTLADFTGLTQLVGIAPLLIFIGLLAGGGWLTFKGFAGERAGRSSRRLR